MCPMDRLVVLMKQYASALLSSGMVVLGFIAVFFGSSRIIDQRPSEGLSGTDVAHADIPPYDQASYYSQSAYYSQTSYGVYSQAYYQGYYQGYYQSYYEGYYQGSYYGCGSCGGGCDSCSGGDDDDGC